jgi:hypothetical protein
MSARFCPGTEKHALTGGPLRRLKHPAAARPNRTAPSAGRRQPILSLHFPANLLQITGYQTNS